MDQEKLKDFIDFIKKNTLIKAIGYDFCNNKTSNLTVIKNWLRNLRVSSSAYDFYTAFEKLMDISGNETIKLSKPQLEEVLMDSVDEMNSAIDFLSSNVTYITLFIDLFVVIKDKGNSEVFEQNTYKLVADFFKVNSKFNVEGEFSQENFIIKIDEDIYPEYLFRNIAVRNKSEIKFLLESQESLSPDFLTILEHTMGDYGHLLEEYQREAINEFTGKRNLNTNSKVTHSVVRTTESISLLLYYLINENTHEQVTKKDLKELLSYITDQPQDSFDKIVTALFYTVDKRIDDKEMQRRRKVIETKHKGRIVNLLSKTMDLTSMMKSMNDS